MALRQLQYCYSGDPSEEQEQAAIRAIEKEAAGRSLVQLPPVPEGYGIACRFIGKFRVLRSYDPTPAKPEDRMLNRIDVGYEE